MTVAIDIRNIGRKRTGDEAVFLSLIRELAFLDSEGEYRLLIDSRPESEIDKAVKMLGIENKSNFKIVPLGTGNKFIWNIWSIPRYLRKVSIDVYHTQYILPFFVPRKTKIVTHIHDVSFRVFPQYIHWTDRLFLRLLIPHALKHCSAIASVSEFTKTELVTLYGVDYKKVWVIKNALSASFSKVISDEEVEHIRKKYKLPQSYALSVGTMQPRKNIPFLLQAFGNISSQVSEVKLVLVGNKKAHHFDKNIDGMVQLKNVSSDVIFPGYIEQDDLPAMFRGAMVYIAPSLYEGFGLSVLEAMSQGVPVIASDIPAHHEVGGDAVVYAQPSNLAEMQNILYSMLTDKEKRKKYQEKGLSRAQQFSWQYSAKILLRLYRTLSEKK